MGVVLPFSREAVGVFYSSPTQPTGQQFGLTYLSTNSKSFIRLYLRKSQVDKNTNENSLLIKNRELVNSRVLFYLAVNKTLANKTLNIFT